MNQSIRTRLIPDGGGGRVGARPRDRVRRRPRRFRGVRLLEPGEPGRGREPDGRGRALPRLHLLAELRPLHRRSLARERRRRRSHGELGGVGGEERVARGDRVVRVRVRVVRRDGGVRGRRRRRLDVLRG
eukprot:31454-Pelagococcus_subviridis.AAC.9